MEKIETVHTPQVRSIKILNLKRLKRSTNLSTTCRACPYDVFTSTQEELHGMVFHVSQPNSVITTTIETSELVPIRVVPRGDISI